MKTQTLNNKSTRRAIRICAIPFAALLAVSASAANLTWDNGASTGLWNTTDANFGGLWTNGNTAVFGGAASSTIDISTSGISATGVTFNQTGDTITGSGGSLTLASGNIITVGSGLSETISAALAGTAGVQVEGGGTLSLQGVSTIDGGGTGTLGLVVGGTSASNTVKLESGGTMGTITANRRTLTIGGSTFGSNSVTISTPGNSGSPTFNASGNGTTPSIGVSSSSNSLTVNNGAYVAQTNGGGTNTWTMGTNAGANTNSILVTGTGSSIVFGSNQAMVVGAAGSSNTVTVSAGGTFNTRRWTIGTNTGDSNSVTITGAGSTSSTVTNSTNSLFEIGSIGGSDSNKMSIAAGGAFTFLGSGNSRNFSIGKAGDNNYLEVTGAGSLMTVGWNQSGTNSNTIPISVGGLVNSTATVTDGGTGNHLDISAGGEVNSAVSIYVMGTNSALNLGNGSGSSKLTVGATANVGTNTSAFAAGLFLKNASGVLNINSGELVAGATGALVSGAGQINLTGPAKFTINSGTNTITSVPITGIGSLNKDGVGTLTISGTTPSYTGDTTITAGTLNIAAASNFLADASIVTIVGSSVFGLNWTGADTITELYIGGSSVAAGTWGSTASGAANIDDTHFTGTGSLNVTGVPEPGTAVSLLGGLGMLLGLRRRRA